MPIKKVLLWPDLQLEAKAQPVAEVTEEIKALIQDLFQTMYAARGAGLAAPQIGVSKRVLVVDVSYADPDSKALAMVNPEILTRTGTQRFKEGCLSVPGIFEELERAASVQVRFLDEQGQIQERTFVDVAAVAVQHEIDHLDGIMFLDKLSSLKRELARSKLKKVKRAIAKQNLPP